MKTATITINDNGVEMFASDIDPRIPALLLMYELPERLKRFYREYDQSITLMLAMDGDFGHPISFLLTAGYELKIQSIFDVKAQRFLTDEEFEYFLSLINMLVPGKTIERTHAEPISFTTGIGHHQISKLLGDDS